MDRTNLKSLIEVASGETLHNRGKTRDYLRDAMRRDVSDAEISLALHDAGKSHVEADWRMNEKDDDTFY